MSSKEVASHYLKSFFVLDFLLVTIDWIPFEMLDDSSDAGAATVSRTLLRGFRLLRLVRLLRFVKVWGNLKAVISRFNSVLIIMTFGIVKLFVLLIGLNHVLACVWFAVGSSQATGWVEAQYVGEEPILSNYLLSYQWSLSQFHGSVWLQSLTSHTNREHTYSILCFLLGLTGFAVFISTILQFTSELHVLWRETTNNHRILCDYLQQFHVSPEVALRAKKLIEGHNRANDLEIADAVLELLPLDVLLDVHYEARAPSLSVHTLFETLQDCFPRAFHRFCHDGVMNVVAAKSEVIFVSGDACHRMLCLRRGHGLYHRRLEPVQSQPQMSGPQARARWNESGARSMTPELSITSEYDDDDINKGTFISEAALWVRWINQGTLRASEDSTLFAIRADRLEAHAADFLGVQATIVIYARDFQSRLNETMFCTDIFERVQVDFQARVDMLAASVGKGWGFFLSHTQRDDAAKLLATELYSTLAEMGKTCWLDVKMDRCDREAMEEGVKESDVFIAIVTDNGVDSYFSRKMCRDEIAWALESGKCIIPVIAVADKHRVTDFIAEGRKYGVDLSGANFCQYDRSGPEYSKASVRAICLQAGMIRRSEATGKFVMATSSS